MIRSALKDRLVEAAEKTGFGDATDLLLAAAKECIYIFNADNIRSSESGGSRMGGLPDLPQAAAWPKSLDEDDKRSRYADFLAQIDIHDIPFVEELNLPRHGYLWFFLQALPIVGQPRIASIYESSPASELQTRTAPASSELVYGRLHGTTSLRFEVGVSLPFGRTVFREALDDASGLVPWEELAHELELSDCVGQLGGFAYSFEGHDLCHNIAVAQLGRPDYIALDHYDTITDLERSAVRVPEFIRSEEQLAKWNSSYAELRPQVEWIERHSAEIADWCLLARFNTNLKIGFSLGDSWPLWIFARSSDLCASNFDHLKAQLTV